MSRKVRLLSAISVVALVLASCGGGDSSSRTKNSARCYATQEEKDAAVKAAQDAFDAAMGGAPTDDSIAPTDSTVVTDSTVEPEESDVTEPTVSEDPQASGGGYRRPAVRAASSGDSTVPPAGDGGSEGEGEGDGTLTPEQQQAQIDLEAAESQQLCDEGSESADEVTCTATATLEGISDDCADGDVRIFNSGDWQLVVTAEDGTETVLAEGAWDVAALTADNPIIIPISYGGNSVEGETSTDGCTAIFTSTGVSWDCPNGELFNVAIEDMSNPGVYPLAGCSSSGSHAVADGQTFWFNFYLVNGEQTFFDGWNNEREQNVPISFEVPEDTEGVCSEISEEVDWDALPFSGQSVEQVIRYSFTVPEDFGGPVYTKFESTEDFDVDIDDESDFESDPCDEVCPPYIGYSMWDLAPGEYFFEIDDNSDVVTWVSNIEIVASPLDFPTLPYSYNSDGLPTTYAFTVAETQTVTFTATAGQTCLPSEDNELANGFLDPELDLFGNGVDEGDDNSGRGAGNCSASLLQVELDPGTYSVRVEDDDREGGSITLGSSIELKELSITWDLVSVSASPDTTFEIVVPAGGAWFWANTVTNQTRTRTYVIRANEKDEKISDEGCGNPDGDLETNDWSCMQSYLALLDADGEEVVSDEDSGQQTTRSASNGIRTRVDTNYGASQFSIYLEEGVYTLALMDCCGPWEAEEPSTDVYEVKFGFGSVVASEIPKVDVVANENPTIPASVKLAQLPDAQLSVEGSVSTSISDGVNTMLCDASCIDAMFASAGVSDGTITINAGADSVTISKGENRVKIPIGKNAEAITATVVSKDGSQVVNLSSKIAQIPANIQASFESKSSSGDGSGFNMLYLLLLIPVLGAIFVVVRRKQASVSL